ncbi:CCA tRNA nucleotidyltransferase [Pseudochrobactrum sp. sp1633]|uniref:CCA tRNA nucleotidyltransferase n=1 Tax=Pseudochrobactrum sp. sp1633 TaxID=3036706 RepID=UPI0025A53120|nr:CCA tRNA nucleotidyltransferase [Pseudochrobactrum sp. sp1633]MDM8345545.1 CCA tRNA nucleotidyltransferase [Pseudochrobactrum sp. sp1633]HWD13172.1 CCA tRNA nucleotidyltransferase [Pseudochrobactrum sp.]
MSALNIADRADWLAVPSLQQLLAALSEGGEEARVVGGAVRNTLLNEPVGDIDIASTTLPAETKARAESCGFKVVPTGIEHGTVTVVAKGVPYEVTTLRADVETHGRQATVAFGRDWQVDAERRDFTVNALYVRANGDVVDHVGGLADIEKRELRFIGDAEQRITEDYLRILRFFRFFAWYGSGRPDAAGLKACAKLKSHLQTLSAERVWSELKKLLSAPDPSRALLWMRQSGVLTQILPESEKWGIDAIHALVRSERDLGWKPDALLRLQAIVPPDAARMTVLGKRLRLSNVDKARLENWALADLPKPELSDAGLIKLIYGGSRLALIDRIKLALVSARAEAENDNQAMMRAGNYNRLLGVAERAEIPVFPISGADLMKLGFEKGPELGKQLKALEAAWLASGFELSKENLLATLS